MPEPAIDTLSPVHFVVLDDATAVNDALLRGYRREQAAPDVRRTHEFAGRFENTYVPQQRLPELTPVSSMALATARRILGIDDLHFGFWFNEMHPGHRTTLHDHSESDEQLSAVYYVRCAPDSGRLILHDDHAQIVVTPREGLLVLFPPDLPHEVEANNSAQMRLSIAFNFGPSRTDA